MKTLAQGIWVVASLLASVSSSGHEEHAPPCVAPTRPPESVPEAVWQRFKSDLHDYRECMSGYIEANHAAAERHRSAANRATEHWNAFVRSELNVREDFPWPPEDPDG